MTQIPIFFGPRQPPTSRRGAHALALWRSRDGILNPATVGTPVTIGGSPNNIRNTSVDARGNVVHIPTYAIPTDSWDLDGDGFCETPTMAQFASKQNYCPYSEDFTNWTATNSPTILTPTILAGEVVLSLLSDDSASLQEFYERQITSTGLSAIPVMSSFIAKGNVNPAGGSNIVLRDVTASVNRASLGWTWTTVNGINAPSPTAAVGTYLGRKYCGRFWYINPLTNLQTFVDVWRVFVKATGFVSGNTNACRVFPSITAAQTGNEFFGGIQVSHAPTVYAKTVATSQQGDFTNWSLAFKPVPMAMTFAVRFIYTDQPECHAASAGQVFVVSDGSGTLPLVTLTQSDGLGSTFYRAFMHNGVTGHAVTHNVLPSFGDVVLVRLAMRADGQLVLGISINGGGESVVTSSSPPGLPAAWAANAALRLTEGSTYGGEHYLGIGVFAGEPSAAYIEALLR